MIEILGNIFLIYKECFFKTLIFLFTFIGAWVAIEVGFRGKNELRKNKVASLIAVTGIFIFSCIVNFMDYRSNLIFSPLVPLRPANEPDPKTNSKDVSQNAIKIYLGNNLCWYHPFMGIELLLELVIRIY